MSNSVLNIYQLVEQVLKTNSKYVAEDGKLLKAKVYSDVMTMNQELLELLLSNSRIQEQFFSSVKGVLVFDKQKFAWFIESKEFLPDSYTKYANKIGLVSKNKFISQVNDVVIDFPYKDCTLVGGQNKEDQKRDEIFFNEIIASDEINRLLSPKVFTNVKRYKAVKSKLDTSADELNSLFDDNEKLTCEMLEEDDVVFNDKDNLIIKGNNLIALSCLLKRFEGKIKCIYIDPPYNTGNDTFNYNDSFNHSTWLTFIKNRLEIAKRLLSEDGVIFVSLDDTESHYCKVLMDSIFGKECFVREIVWLKGNAQNDVNTIQKNTESILVYTKTAGQGIYKEVIEFEVEIFEEKGRFYYKGSGITTGAKGGALNARPKLGSTIYYNPKTNSIVPRQDYDLEKAKTSNSEDEVYTDDQTLLSEGYVKIRPPKRGEKLGCWTWGLHKLESEKNNLIITSNKDSYTIYKKEFIENLDPKKIKHTNNKMFYIQKKFAPSKNFINISSAKGTNELKTLFNSKVFNNPKNEELIQTLLNISTNKGDYVLDFFLGSGTTTAVAHKMGRQYIGIEQMDYIKTIPVERMKKVLLGEQGGISKNVNFSPFEGGGYVHLL